MRQTLENLVTVGYTPMGDTTSVYNFRLRDIVSWGQTYNERMQEQTIKYVKIVQPTAVPDLILQPPGHQRRSFLRLFNLY